MHHAETKQLLLGTRFFIVVLLSLVAAPAAWSKTELPSRGSSPHVLACNAFAKTARTDRKFFVANGGRVHLVPRSPLLLREQCLGTCVLNATGTFLELSMAPRLGEYVRLSFDHLMVEVLAQEYSQFRMVKDYANPRSIGSGSCPNLDGNPNLRSLRMRHI